MQAAGEDLKLRFVKGRYGPYAENLRHVLSRMEGHLVSGSAGVGDLPGREIRLVPGAVEKASALLRTRPATEDRVERVAQLVGGFEDSFGLELLSTVHWVADREYARNLDEIEKRTYSWNYRKKRFSRGQLSIAAQVLTEKQWIVISELREKFR